MENHFKGSRYGCLFDDCNVGGGMAYLLRLIFATFVFIGCNSANALIPLGPASCTSSVWSDGNFGGGACSWAKPWRVYSRSGTAVMQGSTAVCPVTVYCSASQTSIDGASYSGTAAASLAVVSCPANSSTSGSACACNSGYVEDSTHTSCVSQASANCAAVSGQIAGSINSPYTPGASLNSGSASLCDPGSAITGGSRCAVSVTYDMAVQTASGWVKQGTSSFTGSPCTESSAAPTPQPPTSSPTVAPTTNPCSAGSFPGTVNGVSVCSPASDRNVVLSGATSTASAPGGAASSPTSGLGPNAPATAVQSTEQTTCTGGKCTTTKTFTDSAGVVVGTASKDQSLGGFCAENPGASICGDGGTFSGTCGAPPVCTGDAVMCAVAKATFEANCALKMPETSDEKSAYEAGKLKTGDQTGDLPKSPESIGVGPDKFSQDALIGGGSGMTDLTFSVHGQTVTLPFSTINPWLSKLGVLLQAVTFLICAYIVTGNKQGGSA